MGPNLGQRTKIVPGTICCYFFKFGSLVFLEIEYSDSLEQCVTSTKGKSYEKRFWGPNFGQNGPKSGPELVFLLFSQVWFISLPLNCK